MWCFFSSLHCSTEGNSKPKSAFGWRSVSKSTATGFPERPSKPSQRNSKSYRKTYRSAGLLHIWLTLLEQAPSFGWDVKPRSWLSVVIKNPMALLVKSRGVTPVSWQNSPAGPCQSWPPNNPHLLDWLIDSLSYPPVAGVWWVVLWQPSHHPSGCCTLVVVEERPPHYCKVLWVYNNKQ